MAERFKETLRFSRIIKASLKENELQQNQTMISRAPLRNMHQKFRSFATIENCMIGLLLFLLPIVTSASLSNPYITIKWRLVHLFTLFALFQLFFTYKTLELPKLAKPLNWLFSGILCLWGWEYYFHRIPLFSDVTVDRIGFIALTLFFYRTFKYQPHTLQLISRTIMCSMLAFIALILFNQVISIGELFSLAPIPKKIQYTFGNENMAAQFFAVSFLCAGRQFFVSKHKTKIIFLLLSTVFLLFLIKTHCRSAILGASCASALYLLLQLPKKFQKPLLISASLLGAGLITLLLFFRPETVRHRMDMWHNAIKISKDYPLGVGRTKFNFYQVLYQDHTQVNPASETLIERTPHNEFLKYLAEEGWSFIILCCAFVFFFLRHYWTSLAKHIQKDEKTRFIFSICSLLLVEFFLQFPMELAFPHLMIAISVGFILAQLEDPHTINAPIFLTVPLFFIFLIGAVFLFIANLSNGPLHSTPYTIKRGCQLAPLDWRVCNDYGFFLGRTKEHKKAIEHALKTLELRPYQFAAISQMGNSYFMLKNIPQACKVAWFYDRLFLHKSTLQKFIAKHCPREHQAHLLKLPIKEHYRALFSHLPEAQQKRLMHNT